jgi:HD superfamily phosphodiesterase
MGSILTSNEQFHQIRAFTKQHLQDTALVSEQPWVQKFRRAAEHRWYHTLNVLQNAEKIIIGEGTADDIAEAARAAAILHDVSIFECDHSVHGRVGAETARAYLTAQEYPPAFVDRVVRAITEHGADFDDFSPEQMGEQFSPVGKILIEADILDKLGIAAVANAMLILGHQERLSFECYELLADGHAMHRASYFKDYLWSQTGRQLAKDRYAFFLKFLEQLKEEVVEGPVADH